MNQQRRKRTTQIVAYTLSAIVALSMILSLIGPLVLRSPVQPTPTWTPTWIPRPTLTFTPTLTATLTLASTAAPTPTLPVIRASPPPGTASP